MTPGVETEQIKNFSNLSLLLFESRECFRTNQLLSKSFLNNAMTLKKFSKLFQIYIP